MVQLLTREVRVDCGVLHGSLSEGGGLHAACLGVQLEAPELTDRL